VDTVVQALVMGVVQGLTEFLPVSSSGHLIIVPFVFGWDDTFINSLEFSVMLHIGTLIALLAYFRADWLRIIPAGLAAIRDRSLGGDPDRRLAWLIAVATVPALIAGVCLNDVVEEQFRGVGLVVVVLVVGALILWAAERLGPKTRPLEGLGFPGALGIGIAQVLALVPGISRSGISISAGLFAGLEREAAARFSFLMATPVTAAAGAYATVKLVTGSAGVTVEPVPLVVGMVAALVSGFLAIHFLLRYLRNHTLDVFVVYRLVVAAVVFLVWLR
jgi:undecaprenyl-diphosphatase